MKAHTAAAEKHVRLPFYAIIGSQGHGVLRFLILIHRYSKLYV